MPDHQELILTIKLEESKKKLEFLSITDDLTQIYNRRKYEQSFKEEISRSKRTNMPFSLIMFDIDHFKLVNDEFGHGVGDQVLQELGKRLQSSLRDSDTVARLGGDEFVIILENIRSKEDVKKVATKLLDNISRPLLVENHSIEITASIGINIADNQNLPYVELLKNSDSAMYQVKESGKNDFRFYDPEFES